MCVSVIEGFPTLRTCVCYLSVVDHVFSYLLLLKGREERGEEGRREKGVGRRRKREGGEGGRTGREKEEGRRGRRGRESSSLTR